MNATKTSKLRPLASLAFALVLMMAAVVVSRPSAAAAAPSAAAASPPGEASMQELDAIVGNATLVNFGESSHFMQGLHRFVGRAFRHLAEEKGFRLLVIESAWGLDDALQDFFASDRTELTQAEGFFLNAFNSRDTVELLIWIRDFNRHHPNDPIAVAGFQPEQPVTDFDALWSFASQSKQFAAAALKDRVTSCKAGPGLYKGNLDFFKTFYEKRRAGKPVFTAEERTACRGGLDDIGRFMERNKAELIGATSSNAYREAQLHLESFRTYIDTISSDGDELALNKTMTEAQGQEMSRRSYTEIDRMRFEIFLGLQQTRYAGKKMMLWMHNWHATRHSEEVETDGIGGVPKGTVSIGTRLAKAYGNRLVTIGSIVSCPNCMLSRDDALAPKFAAAVGQTSALINLRGGSAARLWKLNPHAAGSIIEQFNQTSLVVNDLGRQFDAIYYLPESKRIGERADPAPQAHYFVKTRLLINPDTGETIDKGVMEVSSGKLLHVGKPADFNIPAAATVFDYGDKYVIPGLIETHGHLYTSLTFGHNSNEIVPRLYLPAGVTSVLSPGSGNPEGDLALKQLIDTGHLDGPRLFLAGEYLEMAPAQAPWMEPVTTVAEAKAKVDYWYSHGTSAVKVYAGMKGEILRAVIAHAHWLGMRVHGHLGATTWTDAIEMGIDVIHHGMDAFPEIDPPGMPPLALGAAMFAPAYFGFDKYYKAITEIDLTQPKIQAVLKAVAQSKVVLVPTAVTSDPYDRVTQHMDEQQPFYSPEAWKRIEERMQMQKNPYAALLLKKNLEFVRRAHEAGCLIATGTDITNLQILPGYSLWREMELFVEAGLKPMEVLKTATINGAIVLGSSGSLGSLEAGKWADFVVLNANPLDNISNVRSVYRVVKGGVVYVPEELQAPLRGRVH